MTKAAPDKWPHAVQADLPRGPAFQPCVSAETAAALFDRLRVRFPTVPIRRYAHGRVIEDFRPAA